MARPKKSSTKKAAAKQTTSTQGGTTITPSVPRQLPLKPIKEAHAAKKAAKKAQAADEVILQFGGKEISHKEILSRVREAYKASGATDLITSLKVYVKPEESKIYYVINQNITGSMDY